MDEYIRRAAAIKKLDHFQSHLHTVEGTTAIGVAKTLIDELPAADVRPVVRGHWIGTKEAEEMGDIMKEFTCSVCGCCDWDCTESESFNFCPNCGADMRKKEE